MQKSATGASWQFCLDCYQNKSKRQGNLEGNFICIPSAHSLPPLLRKKILRWGSGELCRIQSTADSHIRTKPAHIPSTVMLQDQSCMHTLFLRRWEGTHKKSHHYRNKPRENKQSTISCGKITVSPSATGNFRSRALLVNAPFRPTGNTTVPDCSCKII